MNEQKTLNRWFTRPYPLIQGVGSRLLTSLLVGLFVFVFLIFFQPFGISDYPGNKVGFLLGFALITSIVMLTTHFLIPKLLPSFFDPESWTIGKTIVQGLWIVTVITLLNYLYWSLGAENTLSLSALLAFAIITPSVGIFPIMVIVFLNELYLAGRHNRAAMKINSRLQSEKVSHTGSTDMIQLTGEVQTDELDLRSDDLVYIQARDNYSEVHFLEKGHLTSQLMRISLKELEHQLDKLPSMFRCHRSYLVNRSRVTRVSGNARAYTLHLDVGGLEVPVSRSRAKDYFN